MKCSGYQIRNCYTDSKGLKILIITSITSKMASTILNCNTLRSMVTRLTDAQLFTMIEQMATELETRTIISDTIVTPRIRTKATAKANEDCDVNMIIDLLNNTTSTKGEEMRKAFYDKFGKTITLARRANKSGSRTTHYDFEVLTNDDTYLKVEHKSSTKFAKINPDLPPWKEGVQFYNGGMEKFRLSKKYATAWYNKFILSGVLKERYGLTAEIPTLETWIKDDAKRQDNPKTEFGKELKRVVRARFGDKSSLKSERDEFVQEFYSLCTDVDCNELAEDVLPIARESFAEKDIWLQITGNVESDAFNFEWSPGFTVTAIKHVSILKGSDIMIRVECNDGFTFGGILRWGKGMGFSNLRLDLK